MCADERQPEAKEEECSMCGDVGFSEELFRCHTCRQRVQHRYCSRWYLKLSPEAPNWACEWCLSAAADQGSDLKKHIISATPFKERVAPANDDPESKKNCNKRSCASDHQLHQARPGNGAISKRTRHQSNSSLSIDREPCTVSTARGARRFRSLQDVLCSS